MAYNYYVFTSACGHSGCSSPQPDATFSLWAGAGWEGTGTKAAVATATAQTTVSIPPGCGILLSQFGLVPTANPIVPMCMAWNPTTKDYFFYYPDVTIASMLGTPTRVSCSNIGTECTGIAMYRFATTLSSRDAVAATQRKELKGALLNAGTAAVRAELKPWTAAGAGTFYNQMNWDAASKQMMFTSTTTTTAPQIQLWCMPMGGSCDATAHGLTAFQLAPPTGKDTVPAFVGNANVFNDTGAKCPTCKTCPTCPTCKTCPTCPPTPAPNPTPPPAPTPACPAVPKCRKCPPPGDTSNCPDCYVSKENVVTVMVVVALVVVIAIAAIRHRL